MEKNSNKINYYISTKKWTGGVTINKEGIIINACPIAKKWIGQDINTLIDYYKNKNLLLKAIPLI